MGLWRRKPAEEVAPPVDIGPMPSIFDRPPPPPAALLTLGELIPPLWRLVTPDGAGGSDTLRFLPDGRMAGADGGTSRWSLADGRLMVGPDDGPPSWVFDRREKRSRRDALLGTAAGVEGEFVLAQNLDDLQTVYSLARPSQPLLIVFFSYAGRLDGPDTQWEFAEFMAEGRIDLVLISERSDPPFWYLNKTARVLDRLRHLPVSGYRDFLFVGQGSGGFAAMMFAELLSYEFPDCRVRSVTVGAQTTHGPDHETAIRSLAEPAMLPLFIEADALSQKDCAVSGIRDLVRMSTRRRGELVEHRMLYDADNPAQAYYAHLVDDLGGFHLLPAGLGLPHGDGIDAIRGSEAFRTAFDWGRE